eukprot:3975059-Amphidinium_carterae.1
MLFDGSWREVLERQVVQFKGEASGLHARVASLPVTSRPSTAAASVQDCESEMGKEPLLVFGNIRYSC